MSTADIAHMAGFVGLIWLVYFAERRVSRRMQEAQALLDRAIFHRRAIREAMVLVKYGARDEAYQLLTEAFDDEDA